jgi:hypothetical protein
MTSLGFCKTNHSRLIREFVFFVIPRWDGTKSRFVVI